MTTSDYQYTTLAKLEKYAIIDYSAIDSSLTDVAVEAKISDAERYIIGYVGTTFTVGSIPADIELVTNIIAKTMLDNWMIEQRIGSYSQEQGITRPILENYDIVQILEKYKDQYNQKQGVFISKHVHTSEQIYGGRRRPYGW